MKIGPTFGDEVLKASLSFGVSWDESRAWPNRELTAEERRVLDGLIAAHDPSPAPDPIPPLTQVRWNFLLDVTGSREVLEQILDAMPKKSFGDRVAWAAMKATALDAQTFHWDRTIKLVQDMRDQGFKGIPTDEELHEAWMLAAQFEGVK